MSKTAIKTDREYKDWLQKKKRQEERLLAEDLPWETRDPKERARWDEWFKQRRADNRITIDEGIAANVGQLVEAGFENVIPGDTFTLTKAEPLVNMIGRRWKPNSRWEAAGPSLAKFFKIPKALQPDTPPELSVQGLGAYAGQRRARVAPVEMTTFDLSNRIVERLGITDDDSLILPDRAARVLFVLKDLKKGGITITLNRENRVSRGDWPLPINWLVHKRWTEPKREDW